MEKTMRKSRRSSAVTTVLLLILVLLFLATIGATFYYIRSLKNDYIIHASNLDGDTARLKGEMDEQLLEIKNLKEAVIYESSLKDKTLEDLQNDYPILAKQLEDQILSGNNGAKIAYLTFDDGPYAISPEFLDVLEENDALATFFYLKKSEEEGYGEVAKTYDEVYYRIIHSGHTLANHTASHNLKRNSNGIYNSTDNFMDSIMENRRFIEERYGYTTTIMRFPGGSPTAGQLKQPIIERLRANHYGYVDWDLMTGDGNGIVSVEDSISNVLDHTNDRKLIVVLMHDYSKNTLAALPEIIQGLRDQGYVLLPLFYESNAVKK